MKWYVALFLILCSRATVAAPSFDCSKAQTPVEKVICKGDNIFLADFDRLMNDFYVFLKYKVQDKEISMDQSKWLVKRDECELNTACLENLYRQRIDDLAKLSSTYGQVSGYYSFDLKNADAFGGPTNYGNAEVVLMPDNTLSGRIDSIWGSAPFLCDDIFFENAAALGDAWIWQTASERWEQGTTIVLFRHERDKLRIDSLHGRNLCGRNGNFAETYVRAK